MNWRDNTGRQPVKSDVEVFVHLNLFAAGNERDAIPAGKLDWRTTIPGAILKWRRA